MSKSFPSLREWVFSVYGGSVTPSLPLTYSEGKHQDAEKAGQGGEKAETLGPEHLQPRGKAHFGFTASFLSLPSPIL